MEGRCYIQDSEQVKGVEDSRIASSYGNEDTSIEANKRDPEQGWKIGQSCNNI